MTVQPRIAFARTIVYRHGLGAIASGSFLAPVIAIYKLWLVSEVFPATWRVLSW